MLDIQAIPYPAPGRPMELAAELGGFFSGFESVAKVCVFGSLARGDHDRWSDIDVLLVVGHAPAQCYSLFRSLQESYPLVHHGYLSLKPEPDGKNVLGCVLEGESVFHVLDLNFVTREDWGVPGALERFGQILELRAAHGNRGNLTMDADGGNPTSEWTPTEQRIWRAMHWVHKGIKKHFRTLMTLDELAERTDDLANVLSQCGGETRTRNGDIGRVAQEFLDLARAVLEEPCRRGPGPS